MKLLIINNLASGYREGSIHDFARSFIEDGDEVCIRSTDSTTPISDLVHGAQDFDVVVASGGDGTVAAVAYELRGLDVPILAFPAGTANLLAMNLELPTEPHALAKLAREGCALGFDVAEIEAEGQSFGFMIMAGAGYDALIMNDAARSKRLLGQAAYFLSAAANIAPQYSDIILNIDGEEIRTGGIGVLLVNFSKLQFDMSITHSNQPRDGKLDVVVLKAKNAVELLPSVMAALLDADGQHPDRGEALEIYSGKEVLIQADPAFEVQFDGEATGLKTPLKARIFPQATKLLMTEEAAAHFL